MAKLVAVDFDPFAAAPARAAATAPRLTPVAFDPFAETLGDVGVTTLDPVIVRPPDNVLPGIDLGNLADARIGPLDPQPSSLGDYVRNVPARLAQLTGKLGELGIAGGEALGFEYAEPTTAEVAEMDAALNQPGMSPAEIWRAISGNQKAFARALQMPAEANPIRTTDTLETVKGDLGDVLERVPTTAAITGMLPGGLPVAAMEVLAGAVDPADPLGSAERLGRVGRFSGQTLAASAPDMAAATIPGVLPAYMLARTEEVADERAANDGRTGGTWTDRGAALPAAAIESLLERVTTGRLLPGGSPAGGGTLGDAIARVIQEGGVQAGGEAVEEVAPYLAETLGTEKGASLQGAGDAALGGLLAGGPLGAGVQGAKEAVAAIASARAARPSETAALETLGEGAPPAPVQRAPAASDTVAPEVTDDLDALLASLPPEVAQAAGSVLGDPETAAAAMELLGGPAPEATPAPAADPVADAVARWRRPEDAAPKPPEVASPAPEAASPTADAVAAPPAPDIPPAPPATPVVPAEDLAPIDIPAAEAEAAVEAPPIDDTPAPPQPIQYGKRRAAAAQANASPEATARAQARIDRAFGDELDPSNPDLETKIELGRTFLESRRTRQAIDAALAQPDDQVGHMLRTIASQDGTRPEQKWLAEKLAPTMKALGVKLVEPPPNIAHAGAYNNLRNELWIRQAAPTVVLHEALHGATSALLTYKTGQQVNPALGRVRQEFDDMLAHLRKHVEANGIDSAPVEIQDLLENKAGPLANVKELLSYGMTEKPFQEYLATVPAPPNRSGWRTMWDAFKSAVRAVLGGDKLSADQRSFLDALIESSGELVDFAAENPGVARLAQTSEAGRIAREQYQRATAPKADDAAALKDQTSTPAFKRWFGDSKVVDESGAPLVVYHATDAKFDTFERSEDIGFHFGNIVAAEDRHGVLTQRLDTNGAHIKPVFLRIKNPLRLPDLHTWSPRSVINALTDAGVITEEQGDDADLVDIDQVREWMDAAGYDGIVYRNETEGRDEDQEGDDRFAGGDSYIVFRPEQIKSATANRGTFDPDDPAIDAAQIRTTRPKAEARAEQRRDDAAGTLPISRGAPGWRYDTSAWEGRKGALSRARADLQDKMIAWRDVQGQIEQNLQAALPDAQNVYRIENLMHGRVSEGIDRIERQQVEPLVRAMKDAGVKPDTLEEYLYARHAKERNAHIATINPTMPDGGSGMTNAEADAILDNSDRTRLEPLAKRVDAITSATRKRMLDHGLITQEAHDAMEAQYRAYVPLRGKATSETDFEGGGSGAGRGVDTRAAPVKQALGRGAGNRAVSILGEVIGDAQRSVVLAEKARVGRAVMRQVLANPNPSLWTVEPVQTERATDANGEVYERVVNDWSDPSIIAVRHRGQLYKVEIQSQPLAQALNNVGVDQLGTVTRYAGKINRYFSAVLTKYNPAFVPVNAARDALFGLTGLAVEHGEAAALQAALSYPKAALAAGRHAAGKSGTGKWDRLAQEFAEAGGKTGYVNMPSAEDLSRKIGSGSLSSYSPDGLAKAARAIAETVGVLNDAVENALRLSAYATMRDRGMSVDAAAEYAKNLTVNFNRKGLSGSKLNAWFLFYNAAMQGAHRTSKLLRNPKTYAYLGALAGAQVIATMAAMGMEDDEGEPLWNKIPNHVKERNLVIVLPDESLITIPMPYGFNLFTYTAGRITGAVMDKDATKASNNAAAITSDVMSAAAQSFVPVPIGEGALGLLPTVLRIPVNVQTNRDDFGRSIRFEEAYAKSAVPRASMGRPDTLEVFKLAASGLNRMGGGDDLTPPPLSWFDRAPEDLEYLLKELTGGTGKFLVDVATVGQKATGGDYALDIEARERPIVSRFRSNIDDQASQAALYYDRREVIDRGLKRVRSTFKLEGEAAAQQLLEATPELTGAAFKRRKNKGKRGEPPGSVIVVDGSPQIIASDEGRNRGTRGPVRNPGELSVFAAYKAAEDAITARNEMVELAYASTPASIVPTKQTRVRDASIRTANNIRVAAQRELNGAWVRDVVGHAED